ncbi:MAG: 2-oxo acid dehydrogenase subunit E2 [Dehalococcoidia bacterium]|nr:2-oxo acid dehydrogenase subunit E2 [Dehalococcoidia bacterium]
MRRVIADRMHSSLQDMAQLTMGMDVDMRAAVELRERLVADWAAEGVRPTYTDFIIKALGIALVRHPRMNAEFGEGEILLHEAVHVGMAVAVEEGLVVPVVRNADRLTLREIAGGIGEAGIGGARGAAAAGRHGRADVPR